MLELSRSEVNTLRRSIDLNIRRLEKILDEVPDIAERNKREMENKIDKLELLDTKLLLLKFQD